MREEISEMEEAEEEFFDLVGELSLGQKKQISQQFEVPILSKASSADLGSTQQPSMFQTSAAVGAKNNSPVTR